MRKPLVDSKKRAEARSARHSALAVVGTRVEKQAMRWLILWTATAATALGQGGNFSGTAFDLDTGRTQVISGSINDPDRGHNERMSRLRQMNAELETSIATMRQESEMRRQTREMREQTRLLEAMAQEKSRSTGGYAPLASPEKSAVVPMPPAGGYAIAAQDPILIAKFAQNFDPKTRRPIKPKFEGFSMQLSSNEQFTKGLVGNYAGDFTDYRWREEKIDSQTYLVVCEATLDGNVYDFRFKVNTEIGSCRYEGGTALEKLAPVPASEERSTTPPVPDKQSSSGESNADGKPSETWGENDPLAPSNTTSNWWDKYR